MTEKYLDQDFPLTAAKGGFDNALSFCINHPLSHQLSFFKVLAPWVADESLSSGCDYRKRMGVEIALGELDKLSKTRSAETDPHGKDLNSPGAKADAGKLLPALVLGDFSRALTEVAKVGTYGAKKYTPHGWLSVPNGIERYSEAMMRHWLKEQTGEACDPDTDLLHAAHLAWNALARLELMLRDTQAEEKEVHVIPTDFLKAANR